MIDFLRPYIHRHGPWLLGVLGVGLVPWALVLGIYLPSRTVADHWDIAWVGFDFALATMLVATAVAVGRHLPFRGSLAAATGSLLVADAWFDMVTSSSTNERLLAIVLAVVAELPLAAACFVLARPDTSG